MRNWVGSQNCNVSLTASAWIMPRSSWEIWCVFDGNFKEIRLVQYGNNNLNAKLTFGWVFVNLVEHISNHQVARVVSKYIDASKQASRFPNLPQLLSTVQNRVYWPTKLEAGTMRNWVGSQSWNVSLTASAWVKPRWCVFGGNFKEMRLVQYGNNSLNTKLPFGWVCQSCWTH